MFCSNECEVEYGSQCASEDMPDIFQISSSKFQTFVKKSFISVVSSAGGIDKFQVILNETSGRTVFDFDLSNPDDPSCKQNLKIATSLLTISKESEVLLSLPLETMLSSHPFRSLWKTVEDRETLREIFYNQMRIFHTNAQSLTDHSSEILKDSIRNVYDARVGTGLFPFTSLFRHSCDANLKRITVDNKLVLVVMKPVKAKKQLCITYGPNSLKLPRDERKKNLEKLGFECDCVACVKKYPTMKEMSKKDRKFNEPKFTTFTVEAAIAEFKKNCEYIKKNIKKHPCHETAILMEHNHHLLHEISKVRVDQPIE